MLCRVRGGLKEIHKNANQFVAPKKFHQNYITLRKISSPSFGSGLVLADIRAYLQKLA